MSLRIGFGQSHHPQCNKKIPFIVAIIVAVIVMVTIYFKTFIFSSGSLQDITYYTFQPQLSHDHYFRPVMSSSIRAQSIQLHCFQIKCLRWASQATAYFSTGEVFFFDCVFNKQVIVFRQESQSGHQLAQSPNLNLNHAANPHGC